MFSPARPGQAGRRPVPRRLDVRTVTRTVAAAHAAWAATGAVRPRVYGFLLGEPVLRTRVLAGLDAAAAGGVAAVAWSGRPLRGALAFGAASDVARAVILVAAFREAPRGGRRVMVGASLAGAAAVLALRTRA